MKGRVGGGGGGGGGVKLTPIQKNLLSKSQAFLVRVNEILLVDQLFAL